MLVQRYALEQHCSNLSKSRAALGTLRKFCATLRVCVTFKCRNNRRPSPHVQTPTKLQFKRRPSRRPSQPLIATTNIGALTSSSTTPSAAASPSASASSPGCGIDSRQVTPSQQQQQQQQLVPSQTQRPAAVVPVGNNRNGQPGGHKASDPGVPPMLSRTMLLPSRKQNQGV